MSASPALIAVAHGSRDPQAGRTVEQLLDTVRRRRPALPVCAAYLGHTRPRLAETLRGLTADAVVLPLLLTAAYHSDTDIPRELRNVPAGLHVHRGRVLGPHPLLVAALERRLAEVGVTPGDPEVSVVLTAAGSSRPAATASIATIARRWARRGWTAVVPAFATAAAPTVAQAVAGLRRRGAQRIAVAPYFLAPGLLPDQVRAAAREADVVSDVLGAAAEVADVVLDRYDEAVRGQPGISRLADPRPLAGRCGKAGTWPSPEVEAHPPPSGNPIPG